MHRSNHIKFADDTTVVDLIRKNEESAYREEMQRLTAWCKANSLSLNVEKMKEMSVSLGSVTLCTQKNELSRHDSPEIRLREGAVARVLSRFRFQRAQIQVHTSSSSRVPRMDPASSNAGGAPLQNTSPPTDPAELREIIVRQDSLIRVFQAQLEALTVQLSNATAAAPRETPIARAGRVPRGRY
ncbi:hypothetical protein QTP70_001330 [Hemibagrus guttatus]|uniref:Reverse transcriptase domain-containing protein n=1 Tax=Hemibagrus guttatus TaxID=175788 RepID=A0AAE0PUW4_9TELE|nr:hypothetical protein QTP70_001330 [Hemibagrus guttatus]